MAKSYTVDGNASTAAVEFAPASLVEEVLQNVRTILSTVKFGISGTAVDLPMPQAKAVLSGEIFTAVKRYEPRAIIQSISFSGEETGKLVPTLEVRIVGTE